MKKLLSLPPNLVDCFHDVTGYSKDEWFCTNDPVGKKLGSGGGTTWLLEQYEKSIHSSQSIVNSDEQNGTKNYVPALPPEQSEELRTKNYERRLILHAGGQSRRLPSYAPSGKILTPIPVFRWERGQKLSQDLLSLQIPLFKQIMDAAPERLSTMIVSGDVYIRATKPLGEIPDADVVCYGLWLGPEIAKDHGIFVSSHKEPNILKCMVQKPSIEKLNELLNEHYYLTDIGIWLLSDKAIELLKKRSKNEDGTIKNYDLYSEFGCALGTEPTAFDEEVSKLTVAILPLPGGEFYHYGTTHEIISSTLAIQNIVNDQREIMHHSRKPHPSMFIQNAKLEVKINGNNENLWIENSNIAKNWTLAHDNVITGVPQNDWTLTIEAGQCIDIVPISAQHIGNEDFYAVRPYGFNDKFRGDITDGKTEYLGIPMTEWAKERGVNLNEIEGKQDLQASRIFPLVSNIEEMGLVLRWMLNEPQLQEGKVIWEKSRRLCADEISTMADLRKLTAQRTAYRNANWPELAENYKHSVFFQLDLKDAAKEFSQNDIPTPQPISDDNRLLRRIHDCMFRSETLRGKYLKNGCGENGAKEANEAFALLREGLTAPILADKQLPKMSVYGDQIVWGRSPVRIDIAGGWSDTPPYCLMEGGSVINLAIELNGQPPIQTYAKPCKEPHIILRSIDLGASEVVTTYEQLADFNHVGSPFSIPKAALTLCGFHPDFCTEKFETLEQQLREFGCGIEVTLLSAIPAGSGLGTSSMLAANVLGTLNDFCGLCWDKNEIGRRTLVLEQLLTTGGGWQDQYGGILQGIKLLQTEKGFNQSPLVRWLPSELYTQPEYKQCHLLYYTGITRTAKTILAEIVRGMFLNEKDEIQLLREMKAHTMHLYETIQKGDFEGMGRAIRKNWCQNQAIDAGTNPPAVQALTGMIDDLCYGYKLPGAGGGGYLYMVAKDPEAAARIKQTLTANPQNKNARFVDMSLSEKGLQVSRS